MINHFFMTWGFHQTKLRQINGTAAALVFKPCFHVQASGVKVKHIKRGRVTAVRSCAVDCHCQCQKRNLSEQIRYPGISKTGIND